MDWHVLLRRCPSGSVTAVGDLAQRSAPAGARAWADVLGPHGWRTAVVSCQNERWGNMISFLRTLRHPVVLVFSAFLALSLTPALCATFLKPRDHDHGEEPEIDHEAEARAGRVRSATRRRR